MSREEIFACFHGPLCEVRARGARGLSRKREGLGISAGAENLRDRWDYRDGRAENRSGVT